MENRNNIATRKCDVMVIGGGPAGSTISTKLAEKGWKVVMLEKGHHPRFHIGESLLPMNIPILDDLGVLDQVEEIGIRKYGAEFNSMAHSHKALYYFGEALDRNYPYAYEVKREEFDEILFRNAAKKGVDTREGTRVTNIEFDKDKTSLIDARDESNTPLRWHARFLVDASGRSTFLANKLGIKNRNKKHNSAAIFGHFEGVVRRTGKDEGNISLCWFDHGWFWMIPFKNGSMSVGAVCWPYYMNSRKTGVDQFLWDTIALCPAVAERMKDARLISPVTATGNFAYQANHMAGDGYIMVGDAFAFIDPVFSSGVLLGMNSGIRGAGLVDSVLRDPDSASQKIREFDRSIRGGLKIFSWFIYRITQPAMRHLFMDKKSERARPEAAVLSLLAGDLFRDLPIRRFLLFFKILYYAGFIANFRENFTAYRRRRRGINKTGPATVISKS